MMKRAIFIALGWVSVFALGHAGPAVQYVRICSLYGADYFYIPGSDACLNTNTGQVKIQTKSGPVITQSVLAARVARLEMRLKQIDEHFGLQEGLPENLENK